MSGAPASLPDQPGSPAGPAGRLILYVAVLAAGAVALGISLARGDPRVPSGSDWATLAILGACLTAAEYLIIRFRFRGEINGLNLVEAILAPLLFAFSGVVVMATVAVAQVIAALLRRNAPIKSAFNVAQWSLAAGTGAVVLDALRESVPSAGIAATAALTLIAVAAVNQTAFVGVLALNNSTGVRPLVRGLRPVVVPGWLIGWVTNTLVGLLFVFAYRGSRWSILLFPVPLIVLHVAYRGYAGARTDRVRLAGLHQAAQILAEPLDPRDGVESFLREVARCFDARGAALVLASGHGGAVYRFDVDSDRTTVEEPAGPSSIEALVAEDTAPRRITATMGGEASTLLQQVGWRDCLVAPLMEAGTVSGALMVFDQTGLEGFEAGELAVIEALARETATTLVKGRLLEAMIEERRKLSEIVGSTSDGILTISHDGVVRSWNPAMERITGIPANRLVDVSGALASFPARAHDGSLLPLEHWPQAERLPREIWVPGPSGNTRHLSCSYNPVVDRAGEPRTLVMVARDITSQEEMEELREQFGRLAEAEAAQRTVVERLQQALMPPQPHVAGAQLGVNYLPSEAVAPTGGDLYDWQVLPSGEVHLAVVDVLGHGVTATKDAVAVVHALRLLALEDCPLEQMVARADSLLLRQNPDLVSTLVIARYDPQRGRLRLAAGGHPPPLLASRNGGIRELPLSGGAIGWPGAGSKTVVEVHLEPDDVLILYTDGLVEAGKDIIAGTESLMRHVQDLIDLPAEALAAGLVHRALSGSSRHDDSLALVLRHQPTNSEDAYASWTMPSDATALRNARRELASWLRSQRVQTDHVHDVQMIAAELLSNSRAAARTSVTLRVWRQRNRLVLEVEDDGFGHQDLSEAGHDLPPPDVEAGRGLFIVRSLTEEMTTLSTFEGTIVRCTYLLQPAGPGTDPRVPSRTYGGGVLIDSERLRSS